MPFPLETKRLILRHFRDSDLDVFMAYRNDPEVYRYQGWKRPYFLEYATEFIAEMKGAVPGAEGRWFQSALERRQDGVMIGDVAFSPMRGKPQAYVGFTLARPFWGQGYASESMRALIDYLFGELSFHRLVAECDADNANSYHLLERLGFRREAHHVENYWLGGDRWGDEYVYALLEREWRRP